MFPLMTHEDVSNVIEATKNRLKIVNKGVNTYSIISHRLRSIGKRHILNFKALKAGNLIALM